jgi:hypothetical protein
MGRQRLEINDDVHLPMEDRGAIMEIPIFPYEEGDDTKYPIHEITSKSTWVPYRYRHNQISADTSTTLTSESSNTLVAAAANVTNNEVQVETVDDDDDDLTQRFDDDLSDMPGLQDQRELPELIY